MKHRVVYALLIPVCGALLLWGIVPVIGVGYLSLFKTDILRWEFVGLRHYLDMLRDTQWIKAVVNSLLYAMIITPGNMIPAVLLAFMLSGMSKRWQDYGRFALYAPALAAGIILSQVWLWVFHPGAGLANGVLAMFGITGVRWFGSRMMAIGVVSLVLVTGQIGATTVILSGVLLSVPQAVKDAAVVDGARPWQVKRYVELPWVLPTIGVLSLLSVIGTMQVWETVYIMSNGGPNGGSASMMFEIWQTGFMYSRYGMASAKSLVMLLTILVVSIGARRLKGA